MCKVELRRRELRHSASAWFSSLATGLSWLAQADEHPVGFLVAETLDSSLFIAELSLHQEWQGKGIGRRLICYVAEQAREKGYTSLTLTTFRDVPWNAPW